jgi:hypothetical protein
VNRNLPFDFIFDYLLPIETRVQALFGMFYIYTGQKLLLVLRERRNQPEMNGIWIAVAKGGHESLIKELPALRPFPGPRSKKGEDGWLVIPATSDDLERSAIRIGELIAHRDPRIGKIPPPRRPKTKPPQTHSTQKPKKDQPRDV